MAQLQQLCDRVSAFNFAPPLSPSAHRHAKQLARQIDQAIANGDLGDQPRPLCILTFALRCLIYPHIQLDRIPQILDLITNIEFHRLSKSAAIAGILAWGKFYAAKKNAPAYGTQATQWDPAHDQYILSPDQIEYFEHIQTEADGSRAIFFSIVSTLCTFDILHLLQERRDLDVPQHYAKYFLGRPAPPFHSILSEDEKQKLNCAMRDCQAVSYALTSSPLGDGLSKGANLNNDSPTRFQDAFGTSDSVMRKRFPELLDLGSLIDTIQYHIQFVEELVDQIDGADAAVADRNSEEDED